MFENIMKFFKKLNKKEENIITNSKDAAKERLHLVLMQDRANVSADFLELMKQEIIEVIKKYIDVDEAAIDVRLTNKENDDGTNGAPALYANIPILNIKNDARTSDARKTEEEKQENKRDEKKGKEDKKEQNEKEEIAKEDTEICADEKEQENNLEKKEEEAQTKEELKSEIKIEKE